MNTHRAFDRDTWARITEIFTRALDEAPAARAAFLDQACSGDARVRAEVESLLAAHAAAGAFLEHSAGSAPELAGAALPAEIGPYRIARLLGEGGMGLVYLAEDTRLGRLVALKSVSPQFAADATRRERLRREARAAASLSHPGIATVFALEEIDGHLYLASEYVRGETLRDEIGRGPLSIDAAIVTGLGVARALAAAHERGVIHRDLKPENIMRDPSGTVKVLDFGLARTHDSPAGPTLTRSGTLLGTPAYMAPEQIRNAPTGARADVFAFGVVMYEALTGRNPFLASDAASTIARILETEPGPWVESWSESTRGRAQALDRILRQCLAKDPAARPADMHHVIAALEGVEDATALGGREAVAVLTAATPLHTARWWWQFHQGAAAAGYVLLLVPLWRVRDLRDEPRDAIIFLVALVAVVVASSLRLHLWFATRLLPASPRDAHTVATRWIRIADSLFVIALVLAGVMALAIDVPAAVLLVAAGAAVLVSFAIIEPATTRAAFGQDE